MKKRNIYFLLFTSVLLIVTLLSACNKKPDLEFQNQFLRLFNLDFITTECEDSSIIQDEIFFLEINLNSEEKEKINKMIKSENYFYSNESDEYKEIYEKISKYAYLPEKLPPENESGFIAFYNYGTKALYKNGSDKIGMYFVLVKYTGEKIQVYANTP